MRGSPSTDRAIAKLAAIHQGILDERNFLRDVGFLTDALRVPRIGEFVVDVSATATATATASTSTADKPQSSSAAARAAEAEVETEGASAAPATEDNSASSDTWKAFGNETEAGRLLGQLYRASARKPPPPSPQEITLQSRRRKNLAAPTKLLGLPKPPAPEPFPDELFLSTHLGTLTKVRWQRADGIRVRSLRTVAPRAAGASLRHPGAAVLSLARFIRAEDFLLSSPAADAMGCGVTSRGVAHAPDFARLVAACASGAVATTARWQLLDGSSEWRACTIDAHDAFAGSFQIRWGEGSAATAAVPTAATTPTSSQRGRSVSAANLRFGAESEADLARRCAPARHRRRAAETSLWRLVQRSKIAEMRSTAEAGGDFRALGAPLALPPTLGARVTERAAVCMRPVWTETRASPASRAIVVATLAEMQRDYVDAMNDEHVTAINSTAAALQALATHDDSVVFPTLFADDGVLDAEIAAAYGAAGAWRARSGGAVRSQRQRIPRFSGCIRAVKSLNSFQVHVLMLAGMQRMLPLLASMRGTHWIFAVSPGGRPSRSRDSPTLQRFSRAARDHVLAGSPNFVMIKTASVALERTILDVYGEAVHAAAEKTAAQAGKNKEHSIPMEPFYRLLWLVNQMRWSTVQEALLDSVEDFVSELENQLSTQLGWIVASDLAPHCASAAAAAKALLKCGTLPLVKPERIVPLNDNDVIIEAVAAEEEKIAVEVVRRPPVISRALVDAIAAPVAALSVELSRDFADGPASARLAEVLGAHRGGGAPFKVGIVARGEHVVVEPSLAVVEQQVLAAIDIAVDAARSATVDTPVDIPMMRPLHQIRFLRASPLPRDGVTYRAIRRRIAIAVRAGFAAVEAIRNVAMRFEKLVHSDHVPVAFVAAHFDSMKHGTSGEDRNTAHTMAVTSALIAEYSALANTIERDLTPFANFGAMSVDCTELRDAMVSRARAIVDALVASVVRLAAADADQYDESSCLLWEQLVRIEDPDSVNSIDEMVLIDLAVDRTDEAVAEGGAFQARMKARMRVLFDCGYNLPSDVFSGWVDVMMWPHKLIKSRRACVLGLPPLRTRFRLVVADRKDELNALVERLLKLTLKLLRTGQAVGETDPTWYRGKVVAECTKADAELAHLEHDAASVARVEHSLAWKGRVVQGGRSAHRGGLKGLAEVARLLGSVRAIWEVALEWGKNHAKWLAGTLRTLSGINKEPPTVKKSPHSARAKKRVPEVEPLTLDESIRLYRSRLGLAIDTIGAIAEQALGEVGPPAQLPALKVANALLENVTQFELLLPLVHTLSGVSLRDRHRRSVTALLDTASSENSESEDEDEPIIAQGKVELRLEDFTLQQLFDAGALDVIEEIEAVCQIARDEEAAAASIVEMKARWVHNPKLWLRAQYLLPNGTKAETTTKSVESASRTGGVSVVTGDESDDEDEDEYQYIMEVTTLIDTELPNIELVPPPGALPTIEAQLLQCAVLKQSPNIKPNLPRLEEWSETLECGRVCIVHWLKMIDLLERVRPLLLRKEVTEQPGSEDMLEKYAETVKRIRAVQSVSKIGHKGERYVLPGLVEKMWICELIVQCVTDLEDIQDILKEFLNQQRAQCPRMFLLTDAEMIPLVATDTADFHGFQPHVRKLFPAASGLVIDPATLAAAGLESSSGNLDFVQAVLPFDQEGMQVNVMVDALVAASHTAMRSAVLKAEAALEPALQGRGVRIVASGMRVASALETLPTQAVALAWMTRCCKAIDAALSLPASATPSGEHDVPRTLLEREARVIDNEIAGVVAELKRKSESAQIVVEHARAIAEAVADVPLAPPAAVAGDGSPFEKVMSSSRVALGLEVMLAVLLYYKDIVAKFLSDTYGRPKATDFVWTSCMRPRFHYATIEGRGEEMLGGTASREQSLQCTFQIGSADLNYGWEWMGCHQRIALAPHTLRVMRSLAEVSVTGEAALVRGPPGTRQTETIRDMAWLLGRICFSVAVSPMVCSTAAIGFEHITAAVARVLQAAVANGGWAIIEEADLLPTASMVAVGNMLPRVRRAHLGKLSRVKILDATPIVQAGFGVFATTCVTVPGGGPDGWPDAFEAMVWDGAMHVVVSAVPDSSAVCVVRLVARGVPSAHAWLISRRLAAMLSALDALLGEASLRYGRYAWGLSTALAVTESMLTAYAAATMSRGGAAAELPALFALLDEQFRAHVAPVLATEHALHLEAVVSEAARVVELRVARDAAAAPQAEVGRALFSMERIRTMLATRAELLSLEISPALLERAEQVVEAIVTRGSSAVLLAGPTHSGKTRCLQLVIDVLCRESARRFEMRGKEGRAAASARRVPLISVIHPGAHTLGELYGENCTDASNSSSWRNGLFSQQLEVLRERIWRRPLANDELTIALSKSRAEPAVPEGWLVIDGHITASKMDGFCETLDTKTRPGAPYTLAGDHVTALGEDICVALETSDLSDASPGLIARCPVVSFGVDDLNWRVLHAAWIRNLPDPLSRAEQKDTIRTVTLWILTKLFASTAPPLFCANGDPCGIRCTAFLRVLDSLLVRYVSSSVLYVQAVRRRLSSLASMGEAVGVAASKGKAAAKNATESASKSATVTSTTEQAPRSGAELWALLKKLWFIKSNATKGFLGAKESNLAARRGEPPPPSAMELKGDILFAFIWGIGGTLRAGKEHNEFSSWLTHLLSKSTRRAELVDMPVPPFSAYSGALDKRADGASVFDWCFVVDRPGSYKESVALAEEIADRDEPRWELWSERVSTATIESCMMPSVITFPCSATYGACAIAQRVLNGRHSVIIAGFEGMAIGGAVARNAAAQVGLDYTTCMLPLPIDLSSDQDGASFTRETVKGGMSRCSRQTIAPEEGNALLLFVEDWSLLPRSGTDDTRGDALEVMRAFLEVEGWYSPEPSDNNCLTFKRVLDMQLLLCQSASANSRGEVLPSALTSRCVSVNVPGVRQRDVRGALDAVFGAAFEGAHTKSASAFINATYEILFASGLPSLQDRDDRLRIIGRIANRLPSGIRTMRDHHTTWEISQPSVLALWASELRCEVLGLSRHHLDGNRRRTDEERAFDAVVASLREKYDLDAASVTIATEFRSGAAVRVAKEKRRKRKEKAEAEVAAALAEEASRKGRRRSNYGRPKSRSRRASSPENIGKKTELLKTAAAAPSTKKSKKKLKKAKAVATKRRTRQVRALDTPLPDSLDHFDLVRWKWMQSLCHSLAMFATRLVFVRWRNKARHQPVFLPLFRSPGEVVQISDRIAVPNRPLCDQFEGRTSAEEMKALVNASVLPVALARHIPSDDVIEDSDALALVATKKHGKEHNPFVLKSARISQYIAEHAASIIRVLAINQMTHGSCARAKHSAGTGAPIILLGEYARGQRLSTAFAAQFTGGALIEANSPDSWIATLRVAADRAFAFAGQYDAAVPSPVNGYHEAAIVLLVTGDAARSEQCMGDVIRLSRSGKLPRGTVTLTTANRAEQAMLDALEVSAKTGSVVEGSGDITDPVEFYNWQVCQRLRIVVSLESDSLADVALWGAQACENAAATASEATAPASAGADLSKWSDLVCIVQRQGVCIWFRPWLDSTVHEFAKTLLTEAGDFSPPKLSIDGAHNTLDVDVSLVLSQLYLRARSLAVAGGLSRTVPGLHLSGANNVSLGTQVHFIARRFHVTPSSLHSITAARCSFGRWLHSKLCDVVLPRMDLLDKVIAKLDFIEEQRVEMAVQIFSARPAMDATKAELNEFNERLTFFEEQASEIEADASIVSALEMIEVDIAKLDAAEGAVLRPSAEQLSLAISKVARLDPRKLGAVKKMRTADMYVNTVLSAMCWLLGVPFTTPKGKSGQRVPRNHEKRDRWIVEAHFDPACKLLASWKTTMAQIAEFDVRSVTEDVAQRLDSAAYLKSIVFENDLTGLEKHNALCRTVILPLARWVVAAYEGNKAYRTTFDFRDERSTLEAQKDYHVQEVEAHIASLATSRAHVAENVALVEAKTNELESLDRRLDAMTIYLKRLDAVLGCGLRECRQAWVEEQASLHKCASAACAPTTALVAAAASTFLGCVGCEKRSTVLREWQTVTGVTSELSLLGLPQTMAPLIDGFAKDVFRLGGIEHDTFLEPALMIAHLRTSLVIDPELAAVQWLRKFLEEDGDVIEAEGDDTVLASTLERALELSRKEPEEDHRHVHRKSAKKGDSVTVLCTLDGHSSSLPLAVRHVLAQRKEWNTRFRLIVLTRAFEEPMGLLAQVIADASRLGMPPVLFPPFDQVERSARCWVYDDFLAAVVSSEQNSWSVQLRQQRDSVAELTALRLKQSGAVLSSVITLHIDATGVGEEDPLEEAKAKLELDHDLEAAKAEELEAELEEQLIEKMSESGATTAQLTLAVDKMAELHERNATYKSIAAFFSALLRVALQLRRIHGAFVFSTTHFMRLFARWLYLSREALEDAVGRPSLSDHKSTQRYMALLRGLVTSHFVRWVMCVLSLASEHTVSLALILILQLDVELRHEGGDESATIEAQNAYNYVRKSKAAPLIDVQHPRVCDGWLTKVQWEQVVVLSSSIDAVKELVDGIQAGEAEHIAALRTFVSDPAPFTAALGGCLVAVSNPVRVALAAAARPSLLPHVVFSALSALLGWSDLQRVLEQARGSKFVPELAFHPLPDAMGLREFSVKVCTGKTPLLMLLAPEGFDVKTKVSVVARNMSRQLSVRQVSLFNDNGKNPLCASTRLTDEGNALCNATRIVRDKGGWTLLCLTDTAGKPCIEWRRGWRKLLRRLWAYAAGSPEGSNFRMIIAIDDDAAAQLPPHILRTSFKMAATSFPLLPLNPSHLALPSDELDLERYTLLGHRCVVDTLIMSSSEASRVTSLWSALSAEAAKAAGVSGSPRRATSPKRGTRRSAGISDDEYLIGAGVMQREQWEAFPSEAVLPRVYVLATGVLHSALKLVLSLGAQCCPHLASYGRSGVGFSDAQLCAATRRLCLLPLRADAADADALPLVGASPFLRDAQWRVDTLVRQVYAAGWSDGEITESESQREVFVQSMVAAYANAMRAAEAILDRMRSQGEVGLPPPAGPPMISTEDLLAIVGRRNTPAADCAAVALRALRDVRIAEGSSTLVCEEQSRVGVVEAAPRAAPSAATPTTASSSNTTKTPTSMCQTQTLSLVVGRDVSPSPALLRLTAPVANARAIFTALQVDFAQRMGVALEDVHLVASMQPPARGVAGAPPTIAIDDLELCGCIWDAVRDELTGGGAMMTAAPVLDEAVYVHAALIVAEGEEETEMEEGAAAAASERGEVMTFLCPVFARGHEFCSSLFEVPLQTGVAPSALAQRPVFLTM